MKYKILQLDEHGRISFTKEELEKLLDEVYEDGKRDARPYYYPWWNNPGIVYTDSTSTITTSPTTTDKWTIRIGDDPNINSVSYTTSGITTARG